MAQCNEISNIQNTIKTQLPQYLYINTHSAHIPATKTTIWNVAKHLCSSKCSSANMSKLNENNSAIPVYTGDGEGGWHWNIRSWEPLVFIIMEF